MPRVAIKRTTRVTKSAARTRTAKRPAKTSKPPAKRVSPAGGRSMSAGHKAALAQGRRESRAINQYLDALSSGRGKRGRKRTSGSIDARLARIATSLKDGTHLQQLKLIQERMNLEAEKLKLGVRADLTALEKEFVAVAKSFANRRGISYGAFRVKGVPPQVLSKAGIRRARG
jgi:hypothetical protein